MDLTNYEGKTEHKSMSVQQNIKACQFNEKERKQINGGTPYQIQRQSTLQQ